MACYVYVLGSINPKGLRTYVGWTNDLQRRLQKHNSGSGARFTRGRRWLILYAERYGNRTDSMRREWELKKDRKFRRALRANLKLFIEIECSSGKK